MCFSRWLIAAAAFPVAGAIYLLLHLGIDAWLRHIRLKAWRAAVDDVMPPR